MTASAPHAGPAEALAEELARRYDLLAHTVPVGAQTFSLLTVRDTNRLVDAIDPEAFAADERLPYWGELWTSAIALAEWCLRTPWEPGASVLELGCGLGLVGIAAAGAGAHVTMTDYEEDALRFARCNAARNLPAEVVRERLCFTLLDWRTPPLGKTYDVILGADIVYERRFFLPLLSLFDRLLAPTHSRSSIGLWPSGSRASAATPSEVEGGARQGDSKGEAGKPNQRGATPAKPNDAVALHEPDDPRIQNSGLRVQNSEFSASRLPVVVLTEPDRSVGREFFREARRAGFEVATHNSVIYRNGRAAGIVRAELRRRSGR